MRALGHACRAMKMFMMSVLFCCLLSGHSYACYQLAPSAVLIKASVLDGRATHDDKPSKGIRIRLHRALTFNRAEGRKLWESPAIKTAITAPDGLFTFGDVPPGDYWLIFEGGVLGGFPVKVEPSELGQPHTRLWYNYFADGCETLSVESAR